MPQTYLLKTRLPEGQVLSREEILALPYEPDLSTRVGG